MTTDPTITIAGLRARINSLLSAVQHSNRTTAERVTMFVEASSNADRLTAERDALAAQLAEVRAELVQLGGADLARDAAEDRAARLDADLAKVRAELAAAPKVCAIHSYALEGPCMTCGAPWPGAEKALRQERIEGMEKMRRISAAVGCPNSVEEVVEAVAAIKSDLASERAHLAACQTRIAGLEQAANERSAEVARLTARVAELEARTVLTHEILSAAIKKARKVPPYIARQAADEYMPHLGPVTLPAQDRAEELVSAWRGICTDSATCDLDPAERMRRALASLGAPPTSPTQDDPMRHHESRDYALQSPANGYWPADVGAVNGTEAMVMGAMLRSVGPHPISDAAPIAMARTAIECVDKLGAPPTSPPVTIDADALYARCERDFMGGYSGPLYDAFKHGMWTVCNVLRSTPPTSPPAARPVFAGVSVEELVVQYLMAGDPGLDPGVARSMVSGPRRAGVAAVLARLKVTLVAPEFLRRIPLYTKHGPGGKGDPGICDAACVKCEAERIIARLTAGVPVTPERK